MQALQLIVISLWHQRGYTPLHGVCQEGAIETMEYLIKNGAQIDMQDNVSDQS